MPDVKVCVLISFSAESAEESLMVVNDRLSASQRNILSASQRNI